MAASPLHLTNYLNKTLYGTYLRGCLRNQKTSKVIADPREERFFFVSER